MQGNGLMRFRSRLGATAAAAAVLLVIGCGGGYGGGSSTSSGSLLPMITQQPTNVTVAAGQPASFSVTATSAYALTYQWRRDGATIAGATESMYTLPSATPADSGARFSVVVSNQYGSVQSSPATLTVQ